MTKRTPLIAGNWKLNCGAEDGLELATNVAQKASGVSGVDIVIAPPATALAAIAGTLQEAGAGIEVSAQNLYPKDSGAFTGEISAPMIRSAGAKWVILGHSERRAIFGESDSFIREKIEAALAANLRPIACVGETLEEREADKTLEVVFRQVDAFTDLLKDNLGDIVIAYEPVWAIGTGKVASPEQAQEVHAAIRKRVAEKVSVEAAAGTRILYGGSVKGANAAELLGCEDIDGALVGGASLKPDDFGAIIQAAQNA